MQDNFYYPVQSGLQSMKDTQNYYEYNSAQDNKNLEAEYEYEQTEVASYNELENYAEKLDNEIYDINEIPQAHLNDDRLSANDDVHFDEGAEYSYLYDYSSSSALRNSKRRSLNNCNIVLSFACVLIIR